MRIIARVKVKINKDLNVLACFFNTGLAGLLKSMTLSLELTIGTLK